MPNLPKKSPSAPFLLLVLALLFFISGFCGLLYQLIWVRLAYASFGVNAPVLSVVISVFMAGLAVGSWAGGVLAARWNSRPAIVPILFYAGIEALIGFGAFAVPHSFSWGETLLLPTGDSDSGKYLFYSSLAILLSLFPWCFFMGTTFPFMMAFIRKVTGGEDSFSFLYTANVLGALVGVFVTAVFLIEILGFHGTLRVGASLNGLIALSAAAVGLRGASTSEKRRSSTGTASAKPRNGTSPKGILPILFITGFVCMAMEVVWIRDFTIILMTQVYSYAALLFTYLLATFVGSWSYRYFQKKAKLSVPFLLTCTFCLSFLPIIMNDPRVQFSALGTLFSIVPFCLLLGYLTPLLVDQYSMGSPAAAAKAYALNVVGCILGPLAASYLMLPFLGVKYSLVLLSLFFLPFLLKLAASFSKWPAQKKWIVVGGGVMLVFCTITSVDFEIVPQFRYKRSLLLRDYMATVISGGEGLAKRLFVNGIAMTDLNPTTKIMAHLPLAFLPHKPGSALDICFGMGTTFRSLLSWGIHSTAAELDPSVFKSFGYFHPDAGELVNLPQAHLVVDDGRRFLKRTSASFDVITIDPPPPIEAAGSSLLYSAEFYDLVKKHLKKGGILQQWMPTTDHATAQAVARTIIGSFPYVRVFPSVEYVTVAGGVQKLGYFFICSQDPLENPKPAEMAAKLPPAAQKDLLEWSPGLTCEGYFKNILSREVPLAQILDPALDHIITYDRPFNEYYYLRRSPWFHS